MLCLSNYLNLQGFGFKKLAAESFHVNYSSGSYFIKFLDISSLCFMANEEEEKNKGEIVKDFYSAPEQLSGVFTEKNSLFSLGVILFLMLRGTFPFNQDDKEDEQNKNDSYQLNFEEIQEELSSESLELLKGLLEVDQSKRWNYHKALNSSYLMHFHKENAHEDFDDQEALACLKNPLKNLLRTILVRFYVCSEEKMKLLENFQNLDDDFDGIATSKKGIKANFEEFQLINIHKLTIKDKKAKENIFIELNKGKQYFDLDSFWEFLGKERIERHILEDIFKKFKEKISFEDFCDLF